MKKKSNDKRAININIVMSILLVVVLSFISVGYAIYNQRLDVNGTAKVQPQGTIAITNVELVSSINVPEGVNPTFTDNSIDFDLTFQKQAGSTQNNYQAVYSVTITNETFYDFDFNINFEPTVYNSNNQPVDPQYLSVTYNGISLGDQIPAGDEVTFDVVFNFNPPNDDTYTLSGDLETDLTEEPHGSLLGSIPSNLILDLRESLGNDIDSFTLTVINSYQSARTFTINSADSSHFRITNSSGNDYGSVTIAGGDTQTYTVYVKRVNNAVFASDTFTNGIYLSYPENSYVDCGSLTILVDEDEIEDTTPPVISNVTVTQNNATSDNTSNNSVGSVTVTWNGDDPESGVKKYYVVATVNNNSTTYETTNNTQSITIDNLVDGTYVFKVYGENNHGYKASDTDINNATTSQGYCSASTSSNLDWHYTVTQSGNYMQALTVTAVNRGYNYQVTLRANANTNQYNYTLPNTITVRMNGTTLSTGTSSGQYTYSNSSGAVVVYGVTGDIAITANATRSNAGGCG